MSEEEETAKGYMKKETAMVFIFIALIVGFIGGTIYGTIKLGENVQRVDSTPTQQIPGQDQRTVPETKITQEQAHKIEALVKETSLNPENVKTWTRLGNLYSGAKKYEDAIEAYKKSLELNPKNANVWEDMGVTYSHSGQPNKAIEAFDQAIEIDPRHEVSRFNKGVVLMHEQNDFQGAILAWEELIKLNPNAKSPNGRPVGELIEQLRKSLNR